jgi:hypothetical protein
LSAREEGGRPKGPTWAKLARKRERSGAQHCRRSPGWTSPNHGAQRVVQPLCVPRTEARGIAAMRHYGRDAVVSSNEWSARISSAFALRASARHPSRIK